MWPLVFFFRYVVPETSFSLAIGNDFVGIYYNSKVYLLDLLAAGDIAFWSPSEGAGFPFFSSPLPQAIYPLNLFAAWAYRLMGGYSPFDHQLWTVLGVSLFALGLYQWLSLLVPNRRGVIFAVMVMSVSFKVGELLRFPNAVHAAAWMPWLLYGATVAVDVEKRRWGSAIIFASSVMIIAAAYPYFLYYCLFLVPPYVCLMLSTRCRTALMESERTTLLRPAGYVAACLIPAVLAATVCAPYLYNIKVLLNQVSNRSAGTYEFATIYPFTWVDTLGSLIFPPASQTEGWYYFSIMGVLMLAAWAAGVCLDDRFTKVSRGKPLIGQSSGGNPLSESIPGETLLKRGCPPDPLPKTFETSGGSDHVAGFRNIGTWLSCLVVAPWGHGSFEKGLSPGPPSENLWNIGWFCPWAPFRKLCEYWGVLPIRQTPVKVAADSHASSWPLAETVPVDGNSAEGGSFKTPVPPEHSHAKEPQCTRDSSRDVVIILLVWWAILTYISYGEHSYLFDVLWTYVPGFRNLRAWGRLSIVMVPIIALGMARAFSYYESLLSGSGHDPARHQLIRRLLVILCGGSVVIVAVQLILLYGRVFDPYWRDFFETSHGTEYYFVAATVVACVAICVPLGLALKRPINSSVGVAVILALMITVATVDMFPVGSSQWSARPTAESYQRFPVQVRAMVTEALITARRNDGGTISLTPSFKVGLERNWYYERYVSFHSRFFPDGRVSPRIDAEELAAFEYLMGIKNGRRVFCTRRIDHESVKDFTRDAAEVDDSLRPQVVLNHYDGDVLRLTVHAGEAMYLSFIDNWDPDWIAKVNGKAVSYEPLFGTFKTVRLAAGEHRVLLEYRPFARFAPARIWEALSQSLLSQSLGRQ
ncbi:MAG: hypothetical protein AB1646_16910 [Thermodesulfobacteriota bacterium]